MPILYKMLVINVNTKFYAPICAAKLILHIEPKRKEILLIAASCFKFDKNTVLTKLRTLQRSITTQHFWTSKLRGTSVTVASHVRVGAMFLKTAEKLDTDMDWPPIA